MPGFDPDRIEIPLGHVIGGALRDAAHEWLDVRRPSDAQVYARLPEGDAALVDEAVANSDAAFRSPGWRRLAPRDRAALLRRWADLVERDAGALARLEALGSTRPIRDALAWDIPYTADVIRFFAELCDKHGGEIGATAPDHLGLMITEPYGVIGAIAPWNFPLVMACWKVAPALAAGNAVVLKPSEMTPFSVNLLALLAVEAGIPPGIFNVVQGRGPVVGEALCKHPLVAKITFTGSTRTGAAIMEICARHGTKPVTLELGGKSPQLVFDDVTDPDRTAGIIARAIAGNAGQVCVAGSRLIVAERLKARITGKIAEAFSGLKPGVTWDADTTLPPIISEPQCARIGTLVDRAAAEGGTILAGGSRLRNPQHGAYFAPTLIEPAHAGAEIVQEEVFGPVLTIQGFRTDDEAFELARHPVYGLAAGVHTRDLNRAMRALREIRAGTIWINRYGRSNDHILPTGGFGQSGIGKDLGRQAFEGNQRLKTVLMALEA
ncbi:MAG: aldehyde dehydrogenase family protein [Beijerinckiaceae bacterium]|nr:aldehyde dehydrogenase family protein [Beijerinckiaceae bacterium]